MKKIFLFATTAIVFIACDSSGCRNGGEVKESPEELALLVIDDLLGREDFMMYNNPPVVAIHYAEVCAAYGAAKIAGKLGNDSLLSKITERYERIVTDSVPNTANHVDANVYGILPLEIYLRTNEAKYLNTGLEFADGQWQDTLPNGMTSQTRYWIDDIYMIGSLQVQAYRATGEMIYLNRAALEINSYIEKLQQPDGLFFHGIDAQFYWGRGNGWVAAGLAELLSALPETNPYYQNILAGYLKMMKTLAENQAEDGMWHQLIDNKESFKETSSTAMFGFAMIVGVENGLLPEEPYCTSYIKAWNALSEYITADGKIREICVGTGQSTEAEYYLNRPRVTGDLHGQAAFLWFASRLMDNIKKP